MIDFTCECGFKTQAKDDLAGKTVALERGFGNVVREKGKAGSRDNP